MKSVFFLEHSYELEGEEQVKFIGVYSTHAEAEMAIERLRHKKGFINHPAGFDISEYTLNEDHWATGFVTMTSIHVKDKNGEWMIVSGECLPDGNYRVIEKYKNDLLGEFKDEDIVRCEERDEELYTVEKISS